MCAPRPLMDRRVLHWRDGLLCCGQVMHAAGIDVARLEITQDFFGQGDSAPWPTCVCGCAGRAGAAGRSCSTVVRLVK